jgi:uncharacterized protein YbjT (DUF2867 family)
MSKILVVGATGGVGQLVVANLLQQGQPVRLLTRSPEKARQLFAPVVAAVNSENSVNQLDIVVGDIREPASLPAAMTDVTAIICSVGSTAFPSDRWEFDLPTDGFARLAAWAQIWLDSNQQASARNSPAQVDGVGVSNLVQVTPKDLQRFVLVSSCGVERQQLFPYSVLNRFGVLAAKQQGENALRQSGLPFTILRPGRLIDGPYTSRDLNTLLQAKTGGRLGVMVWTGDRLSGQTSRLDVAAACIACLGLPATEGKTYELINQGPRPAQLDWAELFQLAELRG